MSIGGLVDRYVVDKTDLGFIVWDNKDHDSVDVFEQQEDAQGLCDNLNYYWATKCKNGSNGD